ncbi:hypothetical protein, partial [Eggerthella lenta]|uniref:hypothetical protein n=1 Tax=Eggerthella lenta TaxID=84112 RepID=UPI001D06AA2F
RVAAGDTAPRLDGESLERHLVSRARTRHDVVGSETLAELLRRHQDEGGTESLTQELATLLAGSSPDERQQLRRAL